MMAENKIMRPIVTLACIALGSVLPACGAFPNPYKSQKAHCKKDCEEKKSAADALAVPRVSPALALNFDTWYLLEFNKAPVALTPAKLKNRLQTNPFLLAKDFLDAAQVDAAAASEKLKLTTQTVNDTCIVETFQAPAVISASSVTLTANNYGRCLNLRNFTQKNFDGKNTDLMFSDLGTGFSATTDFSSLPEKDVLAAKSAKDALSLNSLFPFRKIALTDLSASEESVLTTHVAKGLVQTTAAVSANVVNAIDKSWALYFLGISAEKKFAVRYLPTEKTVSLTGSIAWLEGNIKNPERQESGKLSGDEIEFLPTEYNFENFRIGLSATQTTIGTELGFSNESILSGTYLAAIGQYLFEFKARDAPCVLEVYRLTTPNKDDTIVKEAWGTVNICAVKKE